MLKCNAYLKIYILFDSGSSVWYFLLDLNDFPLFICDDDFTDFRSSIFTETFKTSDYKVFNSYEFLFSNPAIFLGESSNLNSVLPSLFAI